jgi:hypothetical protein
MNLSSIGSASSVTSGFLSEPPLSPGPAPVPSSAPVPQLRTVDSPPASEALSGSEPQTPAPPVAPLVPPAPTPAPAAATPLRGSEPQSPAAAVPEAPAGPSEAPSLESTLLRMRLVTPDQIASAMREEAETGRPIAEIVVANGWVTAEDLARIQGGAPAPAAPAPPAPEPVAPEPVAPAPAPAAEAPPAPAPPAPPAPAPALTPEPAAAAPAPTPEPAPAPTPAPAAPAPAETAEQAPPRTDVAARVLVRLENGERIEVGNFDGFEAAKKRAAQLMDELRQSVEWPFLSGRYVRPDAIVSIDIDLTGF